MKDESRVFAQLDEDNVSALLKAMPQYRRMEIADLDAVMAIENVIYAHPWTRGNFSDSLHEGYHCWVLELDGRLIGYTVVAIAVGEAHLLNLSIAVECQRRGHGRALLAFVVQLARDYGAGKMFLEVRPSNEAGRSLYAGAKFREIGRRRGYYPDKGKPEDAVVMELELS
jgi:ribosomal-protein-alanine N-acetyltransferase